MRRETATGNSSPRRGEAERGVQRSGVQRSGVHRQGPAAPGVSVSARNLTRRFGDFAAVDGITFDVAEGEVFGFLGANGAGKTTAIRMLTGLLAPTSGEARVAGYDVYSQTEQIKRSIGYMSQKFSLYDDLTVRENIRLYGGIYGLSDHDIRGRTNTLLDRLGLEQHAGERVQSLPLGWKQKLAFSVAMIHSPRIIFLDEPTGGVDPITRRQFWEMIYEAGAQGTTVFVTTHYMDEAEYCDRVSIMVAGRIAAMGTPKGLKEEFGAATIDEVFIRLARPGGPDGDAARSTSNAARTARALGRRPPPDLPPPGRGVDTPGAEP